MPFREVSSRTDSMRSVTHDIVDVQTLHPSHPFLYEVGLPLLASTLSYWTSKGNDYCPHVFVSSHFHALKAFIKDECEAVSYHTMEVRCRGKKLDFLYRLVDGLVESSYAAYTAEEMGVPVDVVNRALQASD
ncbi:unnamed protein product [Nippostrongylus brasiliensis]|uniref:MutS protein homolog 5 (inferred by orthology to a C. elegans protein) n=1 Tax=Nippostrongylus brasiliensis TaxID=27835 RepID=A0A0N4YJM8_NIPBR|nr:unnamed protein product [Nippostrongylus brasiliensis]